VAGSFSHQTTEAARHAQIPARGSDVLAPRSARRVCLDVARRRRRPTPLRARGQSVCGRAAPRYRRCRPGRLRRARGRARHGLVRGRNAPVRQRGHDSDPRRLLRDPRSSRGDRGSSRRSGRRGADGRDNRAERRARGGGVLCASRRPRHGGGRRIRRSGTAATEADGYASFSSPLAVGRPDSCCSASRHVLACPGACRCPGAESESVAGCARSLGGRRGPAESVRASDRRGSGRHGARRRWGSAAASACKLEEKHTGKASGEHHSSLADRRRRSDRRKGNRGPQSAAACRPSRAGSTSTGGHCRVYPAVPATDPGLRSRSRKASPEESALLGRLGRRWAERARGTSTSCGRKPGRCEAEARCLARATSSPPPTRTGAVLPRRACPGGRGGTPPPGSAVAGAARGAPRRGPYHVALRRRPGG
jgi:hypothetical protein